MDGSSTERKKWSPTYDRRGLKCRHCGCRHFYIVHTRREMGTRLIRRWECRNCGHQTTTIEQEK